MFTESMYQRISPFDIDPRKRKVLKLYLYVSSNALFEILKTEQLKLSKAWQTNDITEGIFQNEKELRYFAKNIAYLCFSDKPDSAAMWGYYAERGMGACLEFSFDAIEVADGVYEVLIDGLMSFENPIYIHKVQYREERAKTGFLSELLVVKSKEWEHESEYRILFHLSDEQLITRFDNHSIDVYVGGFLDCLSNVILGPKSHLESTELFSFLRNIKCKMGDLHYTDNSKNTTYSCKPLHPFSSVGVSRAQLSLSLFKLEINQERAVLHDDQTRWNNMIFDLLLRHELHANIELRNPNFINNFNAIGIDGKGNLGYKYECTIDSGYSFSFILWKISAGDSHKYCVCENRQGVLSFVMNSVSHQDELAQMFALNENSIFRRHTEIP